MNEPEPPTSTASLPCSTPERFYATTVLAAPGRATRGDHDYTPAWFAERYVLPPELVLSRANRRLTAKVARG